MQTAPRLEDLYALHGPRVAALLARAKEEIAEVEGGENKAVAEAARDWPLDELCALKFYLSALKRKHGKEKEAEDLALRNLMITLKWRAENAVKLRAARSLEKVPLFGRHRIVEWPHFLVFFQIYESMSEILHECNNDTKVMLSVAMDLNEYLSHRLDRMSKATGHLCKVINVVDLDRFATFTNLNMKVMRAFAETSRENDIYRPQLIHQIIATNVPGVSFFRFLIKVATPLFPSATMEKVKLCAGRHISDKNCEDDCPFIRKHLVGNVDLSNFPKEFGGKGQHEMTHLGD